VDFVCTQEFLIPRKNFNNYGPKKISKKNAQNPPGGITTTTFCDLIVPMTKAKQTTTGTPKPKTKEQKSESTNCTSQNRSHTAEAATVRKRIRRPPALPRISSYAVSLLNRKSTNANQPSIDATDRPVPQSWLTTQQVARRSGYSMRHIQNLCDLGFFLEGEDWKQRSSRPGVSRRGRIYINPAALKKLDWSAE
jgi:hypothetical protein